MKATMPLTDWRLVEGGLLERVNALEDALREAQIRVANFRNTTRIKEAHEGRLKLITVLDGRWRLDGTSILKGYQEIRFNIESGLWDLYWDGDRFGRIFKRGLTVNEILTLIVTDDTGFFNRKNK